ncbi:SDR family oxidoreductase [Nocardioides hwasunensis]|uniref:SDR family oxidoreductase n=1 Tax=Nocardioides hwasunensis TaxID=397258 RepID=A0ABR8MHI4_9ACTN|nr:SDR family oxidoreductase [Nocardioides hwasunensis]
MLTGAGGVLGDAFCRRYARTHDIVAVCRTRVPAVASQHESFVDPLAPDADLADNEARVFTVMADLEQPGQVDRVVELALARHDRIDVLVNGAGHQRHHPRGLVDADGAVQDLSRHLAVNVAVPLQLAVRVAQLFWRDRAAENRAENRSVVNISSLSGSRVYPRLGQGVYAASKAALNQLTRHLADEFDAFGVRVNALAPTSFPGLIPTEDVADAIARLDRETITGRVIAMEDDRPSR